MRIKVLAQPLATSEQLGTTLRAGLEDPDVNRFWGATAWAKRSGLARLAEILSRFRERGGRTELVVGIDEGGATWEGLDLVMRLFDPAYVFHDPGGRTFHPKLYVLEGPRKAIVVVGSANLTRGGLFTNYEAAVVIDVEKAERQDAELLQEIRTYYEALVATQPACRQLNPALLDALREEPGIRIASEDEQSRRGRPRRFIARDQRSVFGAPVRGLAGAPPSTLPPEYDDAGDDILEFSETESEAYAGAEVRAFWKALSSFDVSTTSAPGQIIIPIRFLDFFPPLTVRRDESSSGGIRQSDVEFPLVFRDGPFSRRVTAARVILYEPAAHHPRPNRELRFTFRDREVFERLSQGDILAFTRAEEGISIERMPPGAMGSGRYGSLPGQ